MQFAKIRLFNKNVTKKLLFALSFLLCPTLLMAQEEIHISPNDLATWNTVNTEWQKVDNKFEISLSKQKTIPNEDSSDLLINFDQNPLEDIMDHWIIDSKSKYNYASDSRFGQSAGSFRAPSTKLALIQKENTFFTPGMALHDGSLEFWIKPTRADSGEIILIWKATRQEKSKWLSQQFTALILRNRMTFGLINIFSDNNGKATSYNLQGRSVIIPGKWSHHLLRFDSSTGLLEYLMDGQVEATLYVTSSGKQSGTVFTPVTGQSGRLEVGQNFTGLIDEIHLSTEFLEKEILTKYSKDGGEIISPILDLEMTNSTINLIKAQENIIAESAIDWSFRCNDDVALLNQSEWIPFKPNVPLIEQFEKETKGRYLEIKIQLYPDAKCENSPTISAISIDYKPDLPPGTPSLIIPSPGDGNIVLEWSRVSESDVKGYMVYYGLNSGDYFGTDAIEGPSPIVVDGSDSTKFTLTGLANGTLYFLSVAAFDNANPPHIGNFSDEVNARPSRTNK